ncbi:MAG TPA: VOC family protein [Candidatus Acidoferrum sp.]|nr:VOC family protein [Candidatus Acidoferrum sp.]
MASNRSLPTDTILPHVSYRSVEDAVAWLSKAYGFTEHYRYGEPGKASGAQMYLGKAFLMVKRVRENETVPAQLGYGTQSLTILISDVEAHYRRAKAAGARIVEEPHQTEYGEFQYAALDLDGHHWLFSRHAADRSPADWGATIAHAPRPNTVPLRPCFCYIELPARDVRASAAFYENVFGWNIRNRDSERPSFDDAAGHISGAWVTGRPTASQPGLLPYIWVKSIEATLGKIEANAGATVEAPHPDHPGSVCLIATFRDPTGNLFGLYQEPEA